MASRQTFTANAGNPPKCLRRFRRSSAIANFTSPSTTIAAEASAWNMFRPRINMKKLILLSLESFVWCAARRVHHCFHEHGCIDGQSLPLGARLTRTERGQSRTHDFAKRDGPIYSFFDRMRKCAPLSTMPFVLFPTRVCGLLAPTPDEIETAEIIQQGRTAPTEDFDSLLGKRAVTVGEITDGPFGATFKLQRDQ